MHKSESKTPKTNEAGGFFFSVNNITFFKNIQKSTDSILES